MAVEVLAWNIADGFSDEARAAGILQTVQEHEPTAAVFSEAWHEGDERVLEHVVEKLEDFGYVVTPQLYEDAEARDDRHGMVGIVRSEAVDRPATAVRLAGRNAIHLSMADPRDGASIDFFGVHFNDRGERGRMEQAQALLDIVGDARPVIIGGDFNAMYHRGVWPRALAQTTPLSRHVPEINYAPGYKPPKVHHFLDRLRRAGEMACGATLQAFSDVGFQDTHPAHRPTVGPFNLDHILVRGPRVASRQIHPKTDSDHHAISAVVV
jgi:endonuclease/exonuclease/phosphatase family metal-dependent hydrolase